jgi:hypothetical protein
MEETQSTLDMSDMEQIFIPQGWSSRSESTIPLLPAATSHNTATTDTPFVEMAKLDLSKKNNCVLSIAFADTKCLPGLYLFTGEHFEK